MPPKIRQSGRGVNIGEASMITVTEIVAAHRSGAVTPARSIQRCYERIRALVDPGIFISLRDEETAVAEAEALPLDCSGAPLFGVPVAVKDNIDVAGLPTTAACPAFAYSPAVDATVVAKLRAAGAIVIGKTNLDQFATGLVGTRTPYPVPRNSLRGDLIPGGSSSGSAVAVAAGIVPIALGTDTAGSGRVPAMYNNIIGLKPSLGLVSTQGVVPACRSLDCVSIFALTVEDAWTVLSTVAGYDSADVYSQARPVGELGRQVPRCRIGVPGANQRLFFGDERAASDFDEARERLAKLGHSITEVDMAPFYETARLLYEGPWLAERYIAARRIIENEPAALHPITRQIIVPAAALRATEVFEAFYRLEALRKRAVDAFTHMDALICPTAPTVYTTAQVHTEPILLNSRLGTYTNFVNLLDLCGVAVPAVLHTDATPFGITILAPAKADALAALIARQFQNDTGLRPGGFVKARVKSETVSN
jgi:allophanate hydrolase